MSRAWAFMERVDAPDYDEPERNFMTRWRVISTPLFGLYVHRIDGPDPRPTLHDHPWPFVSLVLKGSYTEDVGVRSATRDKSGPIVGRRCRSWRRWSVHRMRKTDAHTITSVSSPTWTLLVVGRRRREPSWGYWDDSGWTPHDQHPHAVEFAKAMAARNPTPAGGRAQRTVDMSGDDALRLYVYALLAVFGLWTATVVWLIGKAIWRAVRGRRR